MMRINKIETTSAGYTPASQLSTPGSYAEAWLLGGDDVWQKRRFLPQLALLLTAVSLMLCLSTFSASAKSSKAQLKVEIDNAAALVATTKVSPNGWDIPIDSPWASEATVNHLQNLITASRTYYEQELEDYDEYLLPLSDAQRHFLNVLNPSGLMYDYTTLLHAITVAEDAISPAKFVVGEDGKDVPGTKKWASQNKLDDFKQVIKNARNKMVQYGAHGQSQAVAKSNQLAIENTAATLLATDLPAFIGALPNGYMPDYADLKALIASAQYLLDTTVVSVDGADVSAMTCWISAGDSTAVADSVRDLRSFVHANEGAYSNVLANNQALVDVRKSHLAAVMNITVTWGTASAYLYNYRALKAALADAQAALGSIVSAGDGNGISPDDVWATPGDCNSVSALIAPYQQPGGQEPYGTEAADAPTHVTNQALINNAAEAIKQATEALRAAAQNGCKPDYSQLNERIAVAQDMLNDRTGVSVDGHEYASSEFWAFEADRNVLQEAIRLARQYVESNELAMFGNWMANQTAVDNACLTLNGAFDVFLTQRRIGDAYEPSDLTYTDYAGLSEQIGFAEDTLGRDSEMIDDDVVSSTHFGADVPYGTRWIIESVYQSLTGQLAKALDIVAKTGPEGSLYTKTYISVAYGDLSAAVAAANNPQMGRGANPNVLKDEIEAARLLKTSLDSAYVVTSATGQGNDVVFGALWVPRTDSTALTDALREACDAYEQHMYQGNPIQLPQMLHVNTTGPLEYNLRTAISHFKPNLTTLDALPDTMVLKNACDSIRDLVAPLLTSRNNGKDVATNLKWVPETAKTILLSDLAAARATTYPTHAHLLAKVADLKDASDVLLASQAFGSKTPYIVATSRMLPDGFIGAVYNVQVVNASLADVAFSVSNGALPDGLSLDASPTGSTPAGSGRLVGKPTRTGTFGFTIQATHTAVNPVITETLAHAITIYDAPAFAPNAYDEQEPEWVSIRSDIVLSFPAAVPMNTQDALTITLNDRPYRGDYSWQTDTTLVIRYPSGGYECETDYRFVVAGLTSSDGFLTCDDFHYDFRTGSTRPASPELYPVTILPFTAEDVLSDPPPGRYSVSADEDYRFSLKLTVPPDKTPTLLTGRTVNGEAEALTGEPDPEMPETRFLFTVLQIREAIEITVALSPRDIGNAIIGQTVRLHTSAGRLYVDMPQPALLSVYNAAGVLHVRKSLTGSSEIALPKGVYIVRLNDETYKVAIP